jgi:hypothetical protein
MLQGHVRTSPPLPFRATLSPVQRWYAASSELPSLAWAPLFVLQLCAISLDIEECILVTATIETY